VTEHTRSHLKPTKL